MPDAINSAGNFGSQGPAGLNSPLDFSTIGANQLIGLSSANAPIALNPLTVGGALQSNLGGFFTVGSAGSVSIDYLYDGGWYEGEVAFVSLTGMEDLIVGSQAFFEEAGRRALSNSTLGHVAISDVTEGARFSAAASVWESDYNHGVYAGPKSFAMNPGDRFMTMMTPNATLADWIKNPVTDGNPRPLFSLAYANADGSSQVGQIADVDGRGNTFVMEDVRTDVWSDRDYNDIIFQVMGAVGSAVKIGDVIDVDLDWRETSVGKDLLRYIVLDKSKPLIGIIDTGLAASNPDIDPYRVHLGRDYVAGDANPLLQPGTGSQHGTFITGIIAATVDNGIGIDGLTSADTPIYVARAIGSGGWAQALRDFVDYSKEIGQPRAIANLSLDLTQINADGTVTTRYEFTPEERKALGYARENRVLIVAAAGNTGDIMSVLGQSSQEFDNIITVGAADGTSRADYSGYGYGLDVLAEGGTAANPVLSTVGDGVGSMAGTSIAAARVTALAAQLQSARAGLSNQQIIDIIKSTTTDVGAAGWDEQSGFGIVDPERALAKALVTVPEVAGAVAAFATPTTWGGDGLVLPIERAAETVNVSFSARVKPADGVNVRSGPGRQYARVDGRTFNSVVNFDGWTYGEEIYDPQAGAGDARWYRIAGTNNWIASALVDKDAPGSTPFPLSSTSPGNTSGGSSGGGTPVVVVDTSSNSGSYNPGSGSGSVYVPPTPTGYSVGAAFASVYPQYQNFLGSPTSGVTTYGNARYQIFQNGSMVSSSFGTYALYGGIRQVYLDPKTGGLAGWMGVPTGPAQDQGNGVLKQMFEHGYILWNGNKATAYRVGSGLSSPSSPINQPLLGANPTPQNPLRGFVHPLGGAGSITQGNGGETSHTGRQQYAVDYGVPIGTPVYAMRSGRVVAVRDIYPDTGGGPDNINKFNYVTIEHDGGYRSAYLHLQQGFNSRTQLIVGSNVNAGQLIGYSGNSGWSTGPHLHVEIHRGVFGPTIPFLVDSTASQDTSIPPLESPSLDQKANLIQEKINDFFGHISTAATSISSNSSLGPIVSALEKMVQDPLKEILKLKADAWRSLPGYRQIEAWLDSGSWWDSIVRTLATKLQEGIKFALKKIADIASMTAVRIYVALPDSKRDDFLETIIKIVNLKPSTALDGLRNLKIDEAWSLLTKSFTEGSSLISSLADNLLPVKLKNLWKKTGDLLQKSPGPLKALGYLIDGSEIIAGEDKLKEVAGVIGSTVGAAALGTLVQPLATAVPGIGNIFLGAVAAFAGASIGEWMAESLYSSLKSVFNSLGNIIGNVFNQISQSAKEASERGASYLEQFYNALTGTIIVHAEEDIAVRAGQLWKQQFSSEYNNNLSAGSRQYI
jgi:murein DD-endopeptidase MepM/ murein hydrolase activator NlpD